MTEEFLRNVAKIIAGLQAPYSLSPGLLGTAGPAWVKVRENLQLFGWNTEEEVLEAIKEMFD